MKIWRFHEYGPIENLKLEEQPTPEPAAGEALVKVQYAALNPADYYTVANKYPRIAKPPFAVGRDGSGTIVKSASGKFKPGDAVVLLRSEVGVRRDGTLAEYVTVPEDVLAPLPVGWTPQEGAAGPLTMLTAWMALVDEGKLQAGNTVLVTGATGGVGTAAVILAKSLGARVVALSRSEEKGRKLKELGADVVVDSAAPDQVEQVKAALGGGRADVVVENLSGKQLQKSLELTGFKGRVCVIGALAGLTSEIEVAKFFFKRIHIIGIAVGTYTADEAQIAWQKIVATLDGAGRRPLVDQAFAFTQVQEAFAHLKQGPMGKVLVGPINE